MTSTAVAATPSADEDELFDSFLAALSGEEDALPDNVRDQIVGGMRKRYASPPIADLESVLQRSVPAEKARSILFWPGEEEMKLYPRLLAGAPANAPDTHPAAKMQVVALTTMYLVHGRCWARVKAFIEEGGLLQLVDLIKHSNLYIASQAIQCMLAIIDEDMYSWHDPHGDGSSCKTGPDAVVWKQMYGLSRSPLISNLLRHQNPDTYPGSGLHVLRILAFFMSWLRYHFTPNRVLRLSQSLLDLLKEWSCREGVSPPEKQLAGQLYQDFSRYPPADIMSAPQLGSGADGADTTTLGDEQADTHVTQNRTVVNHVQVSEAELLKQAGNDAYRKQDYTTAIRHYSAALDVPVPAAELLTESSRRATLLANRAAAYLSRAAAGGGEPGTCDDAGLLEGCELGGSSARTKNYEAALIDAQAALDLEPSHLKALYRKAQALYWLERYQAAMEAAEAANRAASSSKDPAALQKDIQHLVTEIQRCMKAGGAPAAPGQLTSSLRGAAARQESGDGADTTNDNAKEISASLKAMLTVTQDSEKSAKHSKAVKAPLIQEISSTPADIQTLQVEECD